MIEGLRKHKSATLRVARPIGLPEEMQDQFSELLSVHAGNPRKGHATALMNNVCTEADVEHTALLVHVKAYDDGPSTEQLYRWYSKFGFEKVQDDPLLMARFHG